MGIVTEFSKGLLLITAVPFNGHGPHSYLRTRLPKTAAKIWDFDC
jgi:hypothetical protein